MGKLNYAKSFKFYTQLILNKFWRCERSNLGFYVGYIIYIGDEMKYL